MTIEPATVVDVKALLLSPKSIPGSHGDQVVRHIHGGGYCSCAGESGTGEAMLMAAQEGYKILSLDYHMPRDLLFPAAMDDTAAAWRAVATTMAPRRIVLEGTSAGGGIALMLMLLLKEEGLPLPGAITPGSLVCDFTEAGDSHRANEWVDNELLTSKCWTSARSVAGCFWNKWPSAGATRHSL